MTKSAYVTRYSANAPENWGPCPARQIVIFSAMKAGRGLDLLLCWRENEND